MFDIIVLCKGTKQDRSDILECYKENVFDLKKENNFCFDRCSGLNEVFPGNSEYENDLINDSIYIVDNTGLPC